MFVKNTNFRYLKHISACRTVCTIFVGMLDCNNSQREQKTDLIYIRNWSNIKKFMFCVFHYRNLVEIQLSFPDPPFRGSSEKSTMIGSRGTKCFFCDLFCILDLSLDKLCHAKLHFFENNAFLKLSEMFFHHIS